MDQNSIKLLKKNLNINEIKPRIARQFNDRLTSMAISALLALVGTGHDYRPFLSYKLKSSSNGQTSRSSHDHKIHHLIKNLSININQLNQYIDYLSNR